MYALYRVLARSQLFLILKLFRFRVNFLFFFYRFYIVVLTSAVHYEAACVFSLAKETVLVMILNNITNSVSK